MICTTSTSETWTCDALSIEGLTMTIGSKRLLTAATFTLSKGERVALLGRNGCGKSTLFHWISAERLRPWSVYEVVQELPATQTTVLATVLSAHLERGRLWARQAELDTQDELTDAELAEYETIGETLVAMKADADESRVRRILAGLGLTATQVDGPLTHLSGGWRARVALAQGLFMEPDLLLLDEPTNHLDLNGTLWLQEFLRTWPKTLITISHNAGFVREVARTMWQIEPATTSLAVYRMSYDRFRKTLASEREKRDKAWISLERSVAALKKGGKHKDAAALVAKRATEGIVRPEKLYSPRFFFFEEDDERTHRHGALLAVDGVCLGYEKPVLTDVTFALHPGCRVALVGANGSGKSTLLNFMAGELPPMSCTLAGRSLRVCKFDQHFFHTLPSDLTPLEYLSRSGAPVALLRKVLGATGLEGAAHTQRIGTLSGGQKARVYFGSISAQAPDILLMDEPTNHMDMETVEGLQEGLLEFPGAVLLVSHDIDFLEAVATEVWLTAEGRLQRLGEGIDGLAAYTESVIAAMKN